MIEQYLGSVHCHTDYSNVRLRDSINKYDSLINYAIELGHEVIAITEHECISNHIKVQKYYNEIKKTNPNFKVILGNEIYLCRNGLNAENFESGKDRYFHFILLARDAEGHKQLREISTRAWLRSYKARNMTRVPTYYNDLVDIVSKNPGHLIATTACLGSFLGYHFIQYAEDNDEYHVNLIKDWCIKLSKLFGKDCFYLEMQPSHSREQIFVNKWILKLSEELGIPYIITNDAHYEKKEDAAIHEAYLHSQDGEREVASFYATTYLMNTDELESFFSYFTKQQLTTAYKNIYKIKNLCEDYELTKSLDIPKLIWKQAKEIQNKTKWYKLIPTLEKFCNSDYDGDRLLAKHIVQKIEEEATLQNQETYDAVEECLKMTWESSKVNNTHWSAYFLNLQYNIDLCWEAGTLVGPGRGSGVGFILLYILGITQINPLRETTPTYPWRFLNPNRVSVLDIDTDIEGSKRTAVLNKFREIYGEDRVANVITFGTEKSKSAILTAARGLDIDVDEAQYIASLIPADRGQIRTLKQCYYGDKDNDFDPVPLFVREMDNNPELWKVAQKIEGLVCRIGIHAGGVIFVDKPFTESTGLMRAPDGTTITAYDLHDAESVSLIKIDLLSVEALDKMHICLDLLIKDGRITPGRTLRETYENTLNIYNLERNDPNMWKMIWNHEILSLFQMEKQSGIQGIALSKPSSVDDLATLNSVIRLMAQEKGAEQPLSKFARFKKNINEWYQEMDNYGLTKEEQRVLEPILLPSSGIAESQESFMQLVQIPECGGFDLTWADRLRKAVAKKNPKEYDKLTQEYFNTVKEKGLSQNLCNYVWNVLVATSRGYGFNKSHTLAYSLVALQEMNLAFRFPTIYWSCACLINDSGSVEINEEESQSTNYDKMAAAIGKMMDSGVTINPPSINKSAFTFIPDVEKNLIWFGLKGLVNVSDEIINTIIENRPYTSIKDFYTRVNPKKQVMLSLIKSGAFDELCDRKYAMAWFIWESCDKKKRITLQNMGGLIKYNIFPRYDLKLEMAKRIFEFNRYLKAVCKSADKTEYILDERALNFIAEIGEDNLIISRDNNYVISATEWDKKVYQPWMNVVRNWIASDKDNILNSLNDAIFLEAWYKNAGGSLSAWEMEVMCFYYHEHELINVNKEKYGISNFTLLPTTPIVDRSFKKGDKVINLYKLTKICGTCIAKNKAKSTVILLTASGVVEVKFRKEYFSMFDKQISQRNPDGTKSVVEKSWFNRGRKIVVTGLRIDDNFVAKRYNSVPGHTLYLIDDIDGEGNLILRHERKQGTLEESEE